MLLLFTKICYGVITARQSTYAVSLGNEINHKHSVERFTDVQKEHSHVITQATGSISSFVMQNLMERDIHLEAQACLKTMLNASIIPAQLPKNHTAQMPLS
jgi:hypothetical protein